MSVFGILLCCLIALAVFILAAPFVLTTRFSNLSDNRNGILEFSWGHPWIALVKYDIGNKTMELRVFGRTSNRRTAKSSVEQEPADSAIGAIAGEAFPSHGPLKSSATRQSIPRAGRMEKSASPESGKSQKTEQMPVDRPNSRKSHGDDGADKAPLTPNRFTWSKAKKTIAILRQGHSGRKLFRWSFRLLRLSLKIIRFDHLQVHAKAGFEDPAETGKIYGYFAALHSVVFNIRKNIDVRLEPQFMRNVFEVEGSVGLKTSIAAILMPFVVAILTFPYLSVFFIWRRLKKVYTLSEVVKEG